MSDKGTEREPIPPALSAEEWGILPRIAWLHLEDNDVSLERGELIVATPTDDTAVFKERIPALIALANAALPDSDPRKITREWIETLALAAHTIAPPAMVKDSESQSLWLVQTRGKLDAMADALESYLPPEEL